MLRRRRLGENHPAGTGIVADRERIAPRRLLRPGTAPSRPASLSPHRGRRTLSTMKIEIWSDVICPWCGIGQHRLERALDAFAHRDEVEVVHRSFQLDPHAPAEPRPVREVLARKYRATDAQVRAMGARVEAIAAADGLTPYVTVDNLGGNTRLAHELLALASDRGLEAAAWARLYRAYFADQRSIFDVDALVALAEEIGLDPADARAALTDGRYRARVEADGREAQALGATGVPFVVVDRRYAIPGAQPVETFLAVLERAWRDRPAGIDPGDDASCGPDGCALP